ncbi:sensor histidine kinase [Bacillus sp. mrc49]|uniref:sensor histidine kinase n=1 Tax=Bacillus sp. mrc49 TaxID=2054913 RepID=UPI000C280534|nr:sensor histidine kinase [Bacillus sp. mrc49]PJN89432.1 histidine kinase [Bacillus sp. mrc49]
MIRKYLAERFGWITFFTFLHLFIILVAYLDSAIPVKPIMYIVFLSLIMFCIFLIFRYKKETHYYKLLEAREDNLDLTNLAEADSPFERIIECSIMNQTELLKQSAEKSQMTLEQEKDELLSWIHEVKTPLTAMHLMIDRLEDGMLKSHLTYEWLRIHLLLDQQLHQRRMPFIENDLYMENMNLETIIFDEIKTLQSWCIQKGIGFDMQLDGTEVLSDAKWLAFIIRQLLTNSIKYSENTDILIKSYIHDEQTILQVKDCGRGIDSKDLSRIFDKGFTSTTNHRDSAATGMGLYLTKKAAKSLFISIDVISKPGVGTTMTLRFPKRNDFVNITSM